MIKRLLWGIFLVGVMIAPYVVEAQDETIVTPSGHTLYWFPESRTVEIPPDATGALVIPDSAVFYVDGNIITTLPIVRIGGEIPHGGLDEDGNILGEDGNILVANTGLTSVTIGNNVVEIYYNAFAGFTGLTNVSMGNSVQWIDNDAFNGCSSLQSVNLGSAVSSIGERAFHGCTSLSSITIPNATTSIGEYAFSGCLGLNNISLGNGLVAIGKSAFGGCTSLTSISIPGSVTEMGTEICSDDTSLTSVVIGGGVTMISDRAFIGCSHLTSVSLPNSITQIGEFAFAYCSSLTSVSLPNSITHLYAGTFSGCTSLTQVVLPSSLDTLGPTEEYEGQLGVITSDCGTFSNCTELDSITIPNSTSYIGRYTFAGCTSLRNMTIPHNVKFIRSKAFYCCNKLNLQAPSSAFIAGDAFCGVLNVVIYENDHINYGDEETWGALCRDGYIENGYLYSNSDKTFLIRYFGEDTAVTIENSVTSIRSHYPHECYGVSVVPSTVTTVFFNAENCSSAGNAPFGSTFPSARFVFGEQVKCIPAYIFKGSQPMSVVFLSDSITTIGSYAFYGCSLEGIGIPQSVRNIAAYAFANCRDMGDFELPDSLRQIGEGALYNCIELHTLTIPAMVTYLGDNLTYGCDSLTDVYMLGSNPPYSYNLFGSNVKVHIPCRSLSNYLNSVYWERCNLIDTCAKYRSITAINNGGGYMQLRANDGYQTAADSTTVSVLDSSSFRLRLYTILPNTMASLEFGSSFRLMRLMLNGVEYPLNGQTCEIRDYSSEEGYIEYRIDFVADTDIVIEAVFVPYLMASVVTSALDSTLGRVIGGGECYQYDMVQLVACANVGSTFMGWNNGHTDNPLNVEVMSDTTLVAYFTSSGYNDSILVLIHDTTVINVPYEVHDTTIVVDTLTVTEYVDVFVHDTTYINVHDTTYIDVPYDIHDTTYITLTDTVTNTIYDTVTNTIYDTITNTIYDTTVVYSSDTLWLYDTLFVHDTIYIYDTIYVGVDEVEAINAKIYTSRQHIVVEGADGNTVWLYDVNGRVLATKQDEYIPLKFDVPASGAYLVKIGSYHARKVVVIR